MSHFVELGYFVCGSLLRGPKLIPFPLSGEGNAELIGNNLYERLIVRSVGIIPIAHYAKLTGNRAVHPYRAGYRASSLMASGLTGKWVFDATIDNEDALHSVVPHCGPGHEERIYGKEFGQFAIHEPAEAGEVRLLPNASSDAAKCSQALTGIRVALDDAWITQ